MSPILIPPDNRLLGWSTTDLTLYGAQPLPGMSIGPAAEQGPVALGPAQSEASASPATASETGLLPSETETAATVAPAAIGTSSVAPDAVQINHSEPVAFTQSLDDAFGAGTAAPVAPFFTSVPLAQPAVGATQISDGASTTVSGNALAAPVLGHIDSVDNLLGQVAHDIAATAIVGETLGQVTSLVGDVGHIMQGAAADQTVVVSDLLEGIAGVDPVAGIGTIVDLMKTADIFELRATTEAVDHGTAPVLDALIFDITDDTPLLGDVGTHHDDGLLGGLDTDHGLVGLG